VGEQALLHGSAGGGHFEDETLHLGHKVAELELQAAPFHPRRAEASLAQGEFQLFGSAGSMAGPEDYDAALQLQQGASGAMIVASGHGALHLLDAHWEFIQKVVAELNQQLRVAADIIQRMIAVEDDRLERFDFHMNGHEFPPAPPASQFSRWQTACDSVIGRLHGNLKRAEVLLFAPPIQVFWKVARLAPHSCLLLAEVGLVGADPCKPMSRPPPLGKSSKKVAGIAAGQGA